MQVLDGRLEHADPSRPQLIVDVSDLHKIICMHFDHKPYGCTQSQQAASLRHRFQVMSTLTCMQSDTTCAWLQAIGAGSRAIADTCRALEKLQGQIGKVKRQAIPPVGQELRSLIEVNNIWIPLSS